MAYAIIDIDAERIMVEKRERGGFCCVALRWDTVL